MEGKTSEAMALGLPVVTISAGIKGFRLTPEEDVLIEETPKACSAAVLRPMRDEELSDRIRFVSRDLIRQNYSEHGVGERVLRLFEELEAGPSETIPAPVRPNNRAAGMAEVRLLWRLRRR